MTTNGTQDLALCLSGGGFRATFFHLGVVRYLRDEGLLDRVALVCSVSGGSILAGHLACNWRRYCGDKNSFQEAALELVSFAQGDLRGRIVRRLLLGVAVPRFRRTALLRRYCGKLVKDATLAQLSPNQSANYIPEFHFLATSMTSGNLCFFSKDGFSIDDGAKARLFPREAMPLAIAMAASSAFPPLFPPLKLSREELGASGQEFPYECEYLTDGGVFDNIGLRHFSRTSSDYPRVSTVISSDASGAFDWDTANAFSAVVPRTIRATDILMKRVAELEDEHGRLRSDNKSAFSVVTVDIADVVDQSVNPDALGLDIQRGLKKLRTDFDRFGRDEIECLILHGYATAAKALSHLSPTRQRPAASEVSPFPADPPRKMPAVLAAVERGRFRRWNLWNPRDTMSWILLVAFVAGAGWPVWSYYQVKQNLQLVRSVASEAALESLERSTGDLSSSKQNEPVRNFVCGA